MNNQNLKTKYGSKNTEPVYNNLNVGNISNHFDDLLRIAEEA
jgi:hypothetical protein